MLAGAIFAAIVVAAVATVIWFIAGGVRATRPGQRGGAPPTVGLLSMGDGARIRPRLDLTCVVVPHEFRAATDGACADLEDAGS